MMADFHFLRPLWLMALIPLVLVLWGLRRSSDATAPWQGIIADHLAPWLIAGARAEQRVAPWWLILAGSVLSVLILAGPSWRREPSPFADDVAALAVVIKVTPSMETQDIEPDRLARSVQKIHDLLKARGGSKAALIAYSGSAHLVMPVTTDAGIIDTFAGALDPKIMPAEGDAAAEALKLADQTLAGAGGGSILWIADSVSPDQSAALTAWRRTSRAPVHLLAPVADASPLADAAARADADLVKLAPDDSDVDKLVRAAEFSSPAPQGGGGDRWQDAGYWLSPLLLILILPFFRKGWMQPIAARS